MNKILLSIQLKGFMLKLGLGTVQFGMSYGVSNKQGKTPQDEVVAILKYARENGIYTIDTASGYGDAEKILGQNELEVFKVISKFLPDNSQKKLIEQFDTTLQSLKLTKIYGYLAHRPMEIIYNPWQWEFLMEKKSNGSVEKIGYSLYSPDELKKLLEAGFFPDLVQVPFNYLDRRFEDLIIALKNEGCEIHTRSVFLQGLFFMKPDELPSYFDEIKPIINYMQLTYKNLPGALLKFAFENPFIDKIIIGIESLAQLKENILSLMEAETPKEDIPVISDHLLMPSNWPNKVIW